MKKNKLILIIYVLILIFSLCGCSNSEENNVDKKIQSEIEYLDKKLVGIMNKLNNITLDNYEVKSKQTESQKEDQGNKQQASGENSTSTKKESSEGESSNNSSEESSSKEGSSEGNSSSDGFGSKESQESNSSNIKVLQMQPSNILVVDKENVDWMTLKSEIEVIYSSWNTMLLDLYSVNIANEDILGFSKVLDNTILVAKSENKKECLQELANLYEYLPKYAYNLSIEESTKNILQTKSNILNAYAFVEQENWTEVNNQLKLADEAYTKVTNDVNYIQNRQEEVGRIYVLIKELRNSINLKDKDIFYIKYKNLMNAMQI